MAATVIDIEMANVNRDMEDDKDLMGYAELEIKNQMELMADESQDTKEVKKKKHMARNALTLWREKLKDLEEKRCQLRVAISSSKSEVYQLVSLHSVFAGVVLTAVSTSSRLQCQHLWSHAILKMLNDLKMHGYQEFDFGKKRNKKNMKLRHHHSWRRSLILIPPLTIFTAGPSV